MPKALLLGVCLCQRQLLLGSPCQSQVGNRGLVDREDGGGAAVLRTHVADRCAIGQRHSADAFAVELHELADHSMVAQHLGDGEHQVSGGGSRGQCALQLESDHSRDEHADWLAEHCGLGLDSADTPAQDSESIDHCGVRVGSDDGVRVRLSATSHHHAGQALDVDLMDDACARWNDLELLEGALPPAQELIALQIAVVLKVHIEGFGVRAGKEVDDH